MSGYQPQGYDPRRQQQPQQWGQQPDYPPSFQQQQQQRAQVQPYAPAPYQQPYPQQYPPPGWQPPMQVAPKSTGLAVLLGLLIPGLGCMYAGRAWLGIAILAAWMVSLVLLLVIVGWVLVPACWVASGVLGYTSAQKWNREHGIIS
jgi:TM2 domain-containing membrane protein YozV